MANTKIPVELSSTPGIVDNSNATAITIDSSENVGIGTINPAKKLEVAVTGNNQASTVRIQGTDGNGNGHPLDLKMDGATDSFSVLIGQGGGATPDVVLFNGNRNGNVGIGTDSPVAPVTINDKATISFNGNDFVLGHQLYYDWENNDRWERLTGYAGSAIYQTVGNVIFYRTSAGGSTGDAVTPSESMRITSGGEVNINNTFTGAKLNVLATGSDTSNWCQRYFTTGTASTLYVVDFIDYQGQRVGYITNNPVANTTAYVTSSDYRLKENVDYTWDATTRLKQLKPARFNWIRDESNTLVDGFLAHEVEDIVPEAISGEKDATETKTNAVLNSYGNYIAENITEEEWLAGKENGTYDADTTWTASHTQNLYQGIDQSKLVPLLTKALQEQQTIIEDLQARIETLENA